MPKTKDTFEFSIKGGLGKESIDPSGQSVTWSGQYEGSIDEFRYPTLQLMSIVAENRASAYKQGESLQEDQLKAQNRELGLKIKDFFPPLDNHIDTTTTSSSSLNNIQPSKDLLDRLKSEGITLNSDDEDDSDDNSVANQANDNDSDDNLDAKHSLPVTPIKTNTSSSKPKFIPKPLSDIPGRKMLWSCESHKAIFTDNETKQEKNLKLLERRGEVYLRRKLKTVYEQNLGRANPIVREEAPSFLRRASRRNSSVVAGNMGRGMRNSMAAIFAEDKRTGDDVYHNLVEVSKRKKKKQEEEEAKMISARLEMDDDFDDEDLEDEIVQSEVALATKGLHNLAALNARNSANVDDGTMNEHLHGGFTFYRVNNALHNLEEQYEAKQSEKKVDRQQVLRDTSSASFTSRRITEVMKRQTRRLQTTQRIKENLQEFEDHHLGPKDTMAKAHGHVDYYTMERLARAHSQVSELTRIHRTMGSRYIGYDLPEVMENAHFNNEALEATYVGLQASQKTRDEDTKANSKETKSNNNTEEGEDSEEDEEDDFDMDGLGNKKEINDKDSDDSSSVHSDEEDNYENDLEIDRALAAISVADSVGLHEPGSPQHIPRQPTITALKTHADDILLVSQLKRGVLPERLLKRRPGYENFVSLDLSHYGIGDELGICLGKALKAYVSLDSIGLRSNRLTSKSIPHIIENLLPGKLLQLDIASNSLHGTGFVSLINYFKPYPTAAALVILDVSACGLTDSDFLPLFGLWIDNIRVGKGFSIQELNLTHNRMTAESADSLSYLLKMSGCTIENLELAWNSLGADGSEKMADMIANNTVLKEFDISANNIGDKGAQLLAASLGHNSSLTSLDVSQNAITGHACFVFSQVLKGNPNMKSLNLSSNPLGKAGGRSLFRTILKGLNCIISMRGCVFGEDRNTFNHSNPSADSPYTLDMSVPYDAAILDQLCTMVGLQEDDCSFEYFRVQEGHKEYNVSIHPDPINRGHLISKGKPWTAPTSGIVSVGLNHRVKKPSPDVVISDKGLFVLLLIVMNAQTDTDQKEWLLLLTMDAFFTTKQVQQIIDRLTEERLLNVGNIKLQDILRNVWNRIVDYENKFDFIYHNLSPAGRQELASACSEEKFRFTWANPSGHWRLDLTRMVHRETLMQLIAVDNNQRFNSKNSNRGDTSQNGDWSNFRNAHYKNEAIVFDKEWLANIPISGTVEFDYVSTDRPQQVIKDSVGIGGSKSRPSSRPNSRSGSAGSTASGDGGSVILRTDLNIITEIELSALQVALGLSARRRISRAKSAIAAVELHIAVTKYYFTCEHVTAIMECFSDDTLIQTKVIVSLFCRIVDLENFNVVLRICPTEVSQMVSRQLGVLNIVNPLCPAGDYNMRLKFRDERLAAVFLLKLGEVEQDGVREIPQTEVSLIEAYATMGRIRDEVSDRTMMFAYKEFGEMKNPVWKHRRELLSNFLVGTNYMDKDVMRIMNLYKEMDKAGALKAGPIDLQFREYQKQKRKSERKQNAKSIMAGAKMFKRDKSATLNV